MYSSEFLVGGLPPGSLNSDPTSHGARNVIFLQRFQAWLLKVIMGLQNHYLVQVKSTN